VSREYTNTELERMVQGKPHNPNVTFYEQSKMDATKSRELGKRHYDTTLMVKYTQPGVTDWAPQRAQKEDIQNNPEEYQQFLSTRDDVGSPSVTTIPGINPNEGQELIDYGIITITQLVHAKTIPKHLEHVQQSAIRINEVFKNEREINEEVHQETGSGGSCGSEEKEVPTEAKVMSQTDRPINPANVSGPGVSRSTEVSGDTDSEGIHKGGRINDSKDYLTPNWDISFG
jgi:hypothetical protein